MSDKMKKKTMSYLEGVRMISVPNLASALNTETKELFPVLENLADEGHLRFGGPLCHSACGNCSTDACENPEDTVRKESSIIISMMKEKAE